MSIFIAVFLMMFLVVSRGSSQVDLPDNSKDCPEIRKDIPHHILENFSNIIAYNDNTLSYTNIIFNSNYYIEFPTRLDGVSELGLSTFSNNGKKLMNYYGERGFINFIAVLDISKNLIQKIDLQLFYSISSQINVRWVNDNTIAIYPTYNSNDILDLKIVDVLSGSTSDIKIVYPNGQKPFSIPKLSPDLLNYAYVTTTTRGANFVVRALEDNNDKPEIHAYYAGDVAFFDWSPNAEYIALGNNPNASNLPQRIAFINTLGEEITQVQLEYPLSYNFLQSNFKWSPNGERFLFESGTQESELKIVSLDTLSYINTCVSGEAFWSGDSQLLAVFTFSPPSETAQGFILDAYVYSISENTLYQISTTQLNNIGAVIGWANP